MKPNRKTWLNRKDLSLIQDFIRRLHNFTVGPGLVMRNEPGGLFVGLDKKRREEPPQARPAGSFRCRITAVTGSFPAWSYTLQRVTGYDSSLTGAARWTTDGTNITGVLNAMEFAPASGYPYTYGNGSNITDSSGTIDAGSCVIIPIGVGAVVDVWAVVDDDTGNTVYYFSAPNGSEAA